MSSSIKVSCAKTNLRVIRNFVNETLTELGVKEPELNLMVLAVDEICANTIIHANNSDHSKKLEITISEKNNSLQFEIVDDGKPFTPPPFDEPNIKTLVKKKTKGGIGMMIAHKIMDEITFSRKNSKNHCKLLKKR